MKFDGFCVVQACLWHTDDGDLYLRLVNTIENEGTWVKSVDDGASFVMVPLEECKRLTEMIVEFNQSLGDES